MSCQCKKRRRRRKPNSVPLAENVGCPFGFATAAIGWGSLADFGISFGAGFGTRVCYEEKKKKENICDGWTKHSPGNNDAEGSGERFEVRVIWDVLNVFGRAGAFAEELSPSAFGCDGALGFEEGVGKLAETFDPVAKKAGACATGFMVKAELRKFEFVSPEDPNNGVVDTTGETSCGEVKPPNKFAGAFGAPAAGNTIGNEVAAVGPASKGLAGSAIARRKKERRSEEARGRSEVRPRDAQPSKTTFNYLEISLSLCLPIIEMLWCFNKRSSRVMKNMKRLSFKSLLFFFFFVFKI